jgi:two-component system, sensor histidine kinase and response regulator
MGGLTILIVEDDPDVQQVFAETLEWAGHSVRVAGHGQHALELLANDFRPQLILLDSAMPVMDGLTFLGRVRSIPELMDIPVIVISATAEPPIQGAVCVLPKPMDPFELITVLQKYSPSLRS